MQQQDVDAQLKQVAHLLHMLPLKEQQECIENFKRLITSTFEIFFNF